MGFLHPFPGCGAPFSLLWGESNTAPPSFLSVSLIPWMNTEAAPGNSPPLTRLLSKFFTGCLGICVLPVGSEVTRSFRLGSVASGPQVRRHYGALLGGPTGASAHRHALFLL